MTKPVSTAVTDSFWPPLIAAQIKQADSPARKAWGQVLPKVESLGALLTKALPPRIARVSPWLNSGESCLLWGGTGTGKSMVAMTLALGVAGGGRAFGWEFPNPCRVLYLDGEQDERTLQARFRALADTLDGFNAELAAANLSVTARTAQAPGNRFFDITSADQADDVVAALKTAGVEFVVFDNLSTLTDSMEDENSAAQFKKMQALFSQLKGANIASILVHHAGKNATSYRGSSNIATTFERVVGLIHDPKADPCRLSATVKIDKFRDRAPDGFQPEFPLELSEETTAKGPRLRWKVGDFYELRQGWQMFAFGEYRNNAEFIKAYNEKFKTTFTVSNFSRQFAHRWELDLGLKRGEIEQAKHRMQERREGSGDDGQEY